MGDTTQSAMLAVYREQSHPFDNEQAKMFQAMPLDDRLELLFYMALNNGKCIQHVHELVDPDGAGVIEMPDTGKAN